MVVVDGVPRSLEATARWTAAVRAVERGREDRLFDDPWAATLAGDEGAAWMVTRSPESVTPIVIRTRFFDDWLASSARPGGPSQVVLLAAGLDTRAWRLAWPEETVLFELDRPDVLAAKAGVLAEARAAAACERRPVEADLALDWAPPLRAAGFDPTVRTAWLAEGVLFYLPDDVVRDVLEVVSGLSTPGAASASTSPTTGCSPHRGRSHGSRCRPRPGRRGSARWTTRRLSWVTSAGPRP